MNFGAIIVFHVIRLIYRLIKESRAQATVGAPPPPPRPPLYGYDVPCPICRQAPMQQARTLRAVRGRGLFTSLETVTLAGCTKCVREQARWAVVRHLIQGVWSVGGVFAAPLYAVRDVRELSRVPDPELVESLIRKAGIDPDAARLDADGLTPAERRRVVIASFVASTLVWAEGRRAPGGFENAQTYIHALLEGKLTRGRIGEILFESHSTPSPTCTLSNDERAIMARWIRNLALADGKLTAKMSAAIHVVADALGFSANDITELLKEITYASRGTSSAEEAKRAADARRQQANNGQQKQEDPRSRRQRRAREDLEKARILLGVTPSATYGEIERAYRVIIAACHPDRAGLDPRLQKLFTEKAQNVTWAKEALRRSFQAQAS